MDVCSWKRGGPSDFLWSELCSSPFWQETRSKSTQTAGALQPGQSRVLLRDFSRKTTPPPIPKSCKLGRLTTHVTAVHELTSNPSLQDARFLLQTGLLCKPVPLSRYSLAFRAHRHRLSAVARKKMYALARREMSRRARSLLIAMRRVHESRQKD